MSGKRKNYTFYIKVKASTPDGNLDNLKINKATVSVFPNSKTKKKEIDCTEQFKEGFYRVFEEEHIA